MGKSDAMSVRALMSVAACAFALIGCGGGGSGGGNGVNVSADIKFDAALPPASAASAPWNAASAPSPAAASGLESAAVPAADQNAVVLKISDNGRAPVYRFYNREKGTHFYTISAAERDHVIATLPQYTFEGTSFYAQTVAQFGVQAVYRFYNRENGTHFYSASDTERDQVRANLAHVYTFEGTAWYGTQDGDSTSTPIYRFYNTETGTHFYTLSAQERDQVSNTLPQYRFEGVAYQAWAALAPMKTTPYTYILGSVNASDFSTFLTELRSPGMAGHLWHSNAFVATYPQLEARAIYRRKAAILGYDHRVVTMTGATLPSLADLQAQGSQGYLRTGLFIDGTAVRETFSRRLDDTKTYEFAPEIVDPFAGESSQSLLARFNARGQAGYCSVDSTNAPPTLAVIREVPTTANCAYEVMPYPTTYQELIVQLNAQGAKGARPILSTPLDNQGAKQVYVRDEAQRTIFRYHVVDTTLSAPAQDLVRAANDLVSMLNREGASGARVYQSYTENNRSYLIFVTAYDCEGLLC